MLRAGPEGRLSDGFARVFDFPLTATLVPAELNGDCRTDVILALRRLDVMPASHQIIVLLNDSN